MKSHRTYTSVEKQAAIARTLDVGPEALQRVMAAFAQAGGRTWPGMAAYVAGLWDVSVVR